MPFSELIDSGYDSDFDQVPGLMWKPWVGRRFRDNDERKRLLIIGESHYAEGGPGRDIENAIREDGAKACRLGAS